MGSITDKIKGKANELTGKAKGDRTQQLKGKTQQAKGEAREKAHELDRELSEDPDEGR
jgi:uncharacterized protein YjbJ (UPF0337 family)